MRSRLGYELVYRCPQSAPTLFVFCVHYSRISDLEHPDYMIVDPGVPIVAYRDVFGNWCSRLVAPAGRIRLTADTISRDSGQREPVVANARQVPVQNLPEDPLQFLLGSRYCETDLLFDIAWTLFGHIAPGWQRVQNICDFVNGHIRFRYEHARATRTAYQVLLEKRGVCRDYAHLAIAFCRCLNIPARSCTGYLGACRPPVPKRGIR